MRFEDSWATTFVDEMGPQCKTIGKRSTTTGGSCVAHILIRSGIFHLDHYCFYPCPEGDFRKNKLEYFFDLL